MILGSLTYQDKTQEWQDTTDLIRLVSLCLAAPTPLLTTVTTTCTACNIQTATVSLTHPLQGKEHSSENAKIKFYMCRHIQQAATEGEKELHHYLC
jgi:hypothetical protein